MSLSLEVQVLGSTQGTLTAGIPTQGPAEAHTRHQLTPMVPLLGMANPETHMLLLLGIHTAHQAETHMHHLVEHHIRLQLTQLLMVGNTPKRLHLGMHSKRSLPQAEDLSTAITHMLHCSGIRATDSFVAAIFVLGCALSALE